MRLRILRSAINDLQRGRDFYAKHGQDVGNHFLDSLFADIDSLALYAGVHVQFWGFYRVPGGALFMTPIRHLRNR
jgi:hypothetical protein